jgi:hypothetical protein
VSENAILTPADGFGRTIAAIKLLLGAPSDTEKPIGIYTKFGTYGYSVLVYGSHLDYLSAVNSVISLYPPYFGKLGSRAAG